MHGFDEFFGNLYHLNAEEEPEGYYYPKDPEFKKKYGPRGVLHCTHDVDDRRRPEMGRVGKQKIEDTGPLTRAGCRPSTRRSYAHATEFIDRVGQAEKPFFVWFNATRMHVWTHLKKESEGEPASAWHADGMVEHDEMVGELLKKIDDLKHRRQHDRNLRHRQRCRGRELAGWRHHAVPRREGHHLGRRFPRALPGSVAGRDQAGHDHQ